MKVWTIALIAALDFTAKPSWAAGGSGTVSSGPLGKEGPGQSMHDHSGSGDTGPPL